MRIKNVLITGAGGFIGSHLTERCVESGYRVKAFIRYNSRNNWGWLENSKFADKVNVVTGDIRDFDSVYKAAKDCDTVFHLAALIGIPYSYISPLAYIKTNVEGTYNVLECARMLGIRNILITSTSEIYGTARYVPMDEAHPMLGQSPYSATKIAADQMALSFFHSYGLPVKIVRPFNVYGPRQSARAIIPSIIIQILNGQKCLKLGNVAPSRDLTFVKDVVSAFIEIANSNSLFGEVVSIGMGTEISVKDIAIFIARLLGRKISIVTDRARVRPQNSEVKRLICDNSKIKRLTGWHPRYNLEAGLKETIRWFKKNSQIYKSDIYNI
ncbi:MAG: GDP-mannose 4,6-dehydratase [Candidatus Omnitrophica bacterium]|nr:GDP-mannose 4,6-dehydratase [Candidatus Omnitrophota bacterium]